MRVDAKRESEARRLFPEAWLQNNKEELSPVWKHVSVGQLDSQATDV